jgi:type IV pilus assembly protein PilE
MKAAEIKATDRHSSGFTLVELMVTVAIVAILASIAVPMYSKQVQKSRRVDARTAVLDLAGREERYLSTAGLYTNVPLNLGYSALPVVVGSGYYTVNVAITAPVPPATPPGYTVSATVVAGSTQVKDLQCQYFSVDNTGKQFSSATNGAGADTSTTCWN